MEAMGTQHQNAGVTEAVVDAPKKIVSTPAYMLGQSIGEVAKGIDKAVKELIKMIWSNKSAGIKFTPEIAEGAEKTQWTTDKHG